MAVIWLYIHNVGADGGGGGGGDDTDEGFGRHDGWREAKGAAAAVVVWMDDGWME
jgi:hypothetical protein